MKYDALDFHFNVCTAAGEYLGARFTEHQGDEIDCDAESVVLAIQRAAKERAELLAALRDAVESLRRCSDATGDGSAYRVTCIQQADAAIKKVQS